MDKIRDFRIRPKTPFRRAFLVGDGEPRKKQSCSLEPEQPFLGGGLRERIRAQRTVPRFPQKKALMNLLAVGVPPIGIPLLNGWLPWR